MSPRPEERMIDLLPMAMRDDAATSRFVSIFDAMHAELRSRIADAELYFDARVAPVEFVELLASWIDLTVPGGWEDTGRSGDHDARRYVEQAGPLFRWRGTRRGLEAVLRAATGGEVVVRDSGGVWIDRSSPIGDERRHVMIEILGPTRAIEARVIDDLVRTQMPAGVTYEVGMDGWGAADG